MTFCLTSLWRSFGPFFVTSLHHWPVLFAVYRQIGDLIHPQQAAGLLLPALCNDVIICVICVQDNGGCSKYARCVYLGQGQRNCTCRVGHIGDGINCRGTTNNVSHMTSGFLLTYDLSPPHSSTPAQRMWCFLSYRSCTDRRRTASFSECYWWVAVSHSKHCLAQCCAMTFFRTV